MNAQRQIQQQAKAAIYWLECAELARTQGDVQAEQLATEKAGFASNKAFAAVTP